MFCMQAERTSAGVEICIEVACNIRPQNLIRFPVWIAVVISIGKAVNQSSIRGEMLLNEVMPVRDVLPVGRRVVVVQGEVAEVVVEVHQLEDEHTTLRICLLLLLGQSVRLRCLHRLLPLK